MQSNNTGHDDILPTITGYHRVISIAILSKRYETLGTVLDDLCTMIDQLCRDESKKSVVGSYLLLVSHSLFQIVEADFAYNEKKEGVPVPLKCLERTFSCMDLLISNVNLSSSSAGNDLLIKYLSVFRCVFMMHVVPSASDEIFSTEEIKLHIIKGFTSLVKIHILKADLEIFSSNKFQPLIAMFLSHLLDIALQERSSQLREESLRSISIIVQCIKSQAIILSFFPGLVSGLFKLLYTLPGAVLSQDGITPSKKPANFTKLGQSIVSEAFSTLQSLILGACSDERNEHILELESWREDLSTIDFTAAISQIHQQKGDQLVSKELEEIRNMRVHFDNQIQKIFSTENYSHHRSPYIRCQMMKTCEIILENSSRTLWISIPRVIECLMMGSSDADSPDDEHNYRLLAESILSRFNQTSVADDRLLEKMYERFVQLVDSVPTVCTVSTNESDKLAQLILAQSYIRLFLKQKRFDSDLIQRIAFALLVALQLEDSNQSTKIVETKVQNSDPSIKLQTPVHDYPRKYFKNVRDERIIETLYAICVDIGLCGDLTIVRAFTDHIRQLFLEITSSRSRNIHALHKECILVNQQILSGFTRYIQISTAKTSEQRIMLADIIETIMEDYLTPEIWSISSQAQENIPLMHDCLLMNSLMLESIGNFVHFLSKTAEEETWSMTDRNAFLVKSLFSVVEKLGNPYDIVSQSALETLDRIAKSDQKGLALDSQVKRVMHLIVSHIDFFADEILRRMRFLNLYPETPNVLKALFKYAASVELLSDYSLQDATIVTVVPELLESILDALRDYQVQSTYSNSYAKVFFECFNYLVQVIVQRKKKRDLLPAVPPQKQLNSGVDNSDESQETEEAEEEEENESEEVKRERGIIEKILRCCQNFIANEDTHIKILVLDIIETSLFTYLDDTQKIQGKAFPLLHLLWPRIITRLVSVTEKPVVQIKVLELVERLIELSDQFTHSRVVEDLLPKLTSHEMLLSNFPEHNKQCREYIQTRTQHNERMVMTKGTNQQPFSYTVTTTSYKLHRSLLQFIERLSSDPHSLFMRRMSLGNRQKNLHAYDLCRIVLPLLDSRMPDDLIQISSRIMRNIGRVDYASVWLAVMEHSSYHKPVTLKPNNQELPDIKFPKIASTKTTASSVQVDFSFVHTHLLS